MAVDRTIRILIISCGILSLVSVIMCLYSISTANWYHSSIQRIGLFHTCNITISKTAKCEKNIYANSNQYSNDPVNGVYQLTYNKRFRGSGGLAIVAVIFQIASIILSIYASIIFLPNPSVTCWILPIIQFVVSLFMLATLSEASYGINMNGQSSSIYEAALVSTMASTIVASIAADRINKLST
ncbi:unnamed protein product [Didymodactylos carnosus]|uniref:Uncharacterized protein n=1 Tax=Didymodactylos carnosus TaxID=1234261 RepID=A0A813PIJ0_9BILA|nr:unnamed protein product [Didymodactylos carnosus]CAF0766262.1 unnamed protein product [Didymodactylos carnosus]CAF3531352.1 unnamed protein product [Didymodactylos carnosus]CAF3546565.1 unnamed protein product [Didymodactylos carnosus]